MDTRLEEPPAGSPPRQFGEEVCAFIVGLGATIDQPRGESGHHLVRTDNRLSLTLPTVFGITDTALEVGTLFGVAARRVAVFGPPGAP